MRTSRRLSRAAAGAGSHDDAPEYWITYSDLLVSLLVVFALLLFIALAQIKRSADEAAAGRVAVAQTLRTTAAAMDAAAKSMGDSSVKYEPRTRTLTMRDEVLFSFGSATLRPEANVVIEKVARRFVPTLLQDTAVANHIDAIIIEGHTDTVGTYLSNLDLSQRRAQSVMRALVETTYGIPKAERLRELLVASGRSEVEALRMGAAYDPARARRIVVRVRLRDEELLKRMLGSDSAQFVAHAGAGAQPDGAGRE